MMCGVPWAASFALFYLVSLRHVAHNSFLNSYWGNAFMPLPPMSIHDLGWFQAAFFTTFRDPYEWDGESATWVRRSASADPPTRDGYAMPTTPAARRSSCSAAPSLAST